MSDLNEPLHVDDWLDTPNRTSDPQGEVYAKFVLEYHRLPAWKKMAYYPWMKDHKLFCTYEGKRYRCTGASRMGDVWLAQDFERENGYDLRVDVAKCSEWSPEPGAVTSKEVEDTKLSVSWKVRSTIATYLGKSNPQDIAPETMFYDLSVDEIDREEIALTLEDQFGIEISQEFSQSMKDVAQLIGYVENKVKEK